MTSLRGAIRSAPTPLPNVAAMDEFQRSQIEQRLVLERNRSIAVLRRYGAAALADLAGEASALSRSPSHMADQASDIMERELALFFASKEGRHLSEIENALRRLYEDPDRFGRCSRCLEQIPFPRLDAVPYATSCVDCQSVAEVAA